ncbi:hypothetical protein, partial [Bradyrhizobium liaoningense]|uniref:hypothetical protein n=1 Tax=Bradyrhizobium liaoningense TaxID=43992 RepID=UPI001BA8EDE6
MTISEGRNWSIPTLVSTAVDNIMPATGYNHERLWNTGSPSRSGRRPHVRGCRHSFASSRLISPELCFGRSTLVAKRAQGRPGAGGTRGPLRERHTQEEP